MATLYPSDLEKEGETVQLDTVDTANEISLTKTGTNTRGETNALVLLCSVDSGAGSNRILRVGKNSNIEPPEVWTAYIRRELELQPGEWGVFILGVVNSPGAVQDDNTINVGLNNASNVQLAVIRISTSLLTSQQ